MGAGPGHPELLTLKAADLLKLCDVVVYDRLIQEEVLALAKPSAERVYMGKPVGKHDSRQEEANDILVRKAHEGKTVVRLKGGDPFVFGRGGEEAEYLAAHGIPFEVIPGVTSAFAAPLSAGIPVTHRDAASSVAVITGHEAKRDHNRVDWRALSGIDTLVFLMSVNNLPMISRTLIEHGKDPATPAAMIQMAFWPDERAVTGTLATIADDVERAGLRPPATLVIGEVVRLREKLALPDRDLRRRSDGSSRFDPAPAPDQLLRLATAGVASQALGYALEFRLFDRLEQPSQAATLAAELGLDADALTELLEALVALGIAERQAEGYRNLELASRYLTSTSPQSLRATLLHQTSLATNWAPLAAYLREGRGDLMDVPGDGAHQDSCEALARFAAPAVTEKLDLGGPGPVLLVGYGGDAYRLAIAARWPGLEVQAVNPFLDGHAPPAAAMGAEAGSIGAIILSGLLGSASRGEVRQIVETAARRLVAGGLLALHDAFLPAGVLPPPEVVLGSLGRHINRGGCRTWTIERLLETLRALGFDAADPQPLPAGTVLVTARKPK